MSIEIVDGKPKVEWEPKVNRWTGAEIQAVLKGAETLNGEWKAVEEATAAEKAAGRPCQFRHCTIRGCAPCAMSG